MPQTSFKARQMVPGQDNVSTMALHYGLRPTDILHICREAGVLLIREDGFKGLVVEVATKTTLAGEPRNRNRKVLGWSDAQAGVNPDTTKLTRPAIMAVARWKHENTDYENH